MAVYGIVAFDITSDVARGMVWKKLRGKVVRASKSVMIFDFSLRDTVQRVVTSCVDPKTDRVFPAQALRDEKDAQTWVRMAMQAMFDEIVPSLRRRIDELETELDKGELKVLDVSDQFGRRIKGVKQKIEDAMIALTTFRLSGEFDELRTAKLAEMDAMEETLALKLVKKALADEKKGKVA